VNKHVFALILAVVGGYLLHEGWVAAHSLGGTVDYYSKGIAYKVAGRIQLPGFVLTFLGGAAFIGAAWWVLAAKRRSRSTKRRPSKR
jgi:hypothetical protein